MAELAGAADSKFNWTNHILRPCCCVNNNVFDIAIAVLVMCTASSLEARFG
jgi:hypothetical protein